MRRGAAQDLGPNLLDKGRGHYSLRFVVDEKTEYLEDNLEFCADDDVVTVGSGAVERAHASQ